jgi:hypothetical protein
MRENKMKEGFIEQNNLPIISIKERFNCFYFFGKKKTVFTSYLNDS